MWDSPGIQRSSTYIKISLACCWLKGLLQIIRNNFHTQEAMKERKNTQSTKSPLWVYRLSTLLMQRVHHIL